MTTQPELTHKTVKCNDNALLDELDRLKQAGYRIASISIKGTADYIIEAYLVEQEESQQEMKL